MFMRPSQVAAYLGITEATAREYARRGIIPARKIGKHWRFLEADLHEVGTRNGCSTSAQQNQGHTGGSGSRSGGLKYGNRVAQIARNVRKRLKGT